MLNIFESIFSFEKNSQSQAPNSIVTKQNENERSAFIAMNTRTPILCGLESVESDVVEQTIQQNWTYYTATSCELINGLKTAQSLLNEESKSRFKKVVLLSNGGYPYDSQLNNILSSMESDGILLQTIPIGVDCNLKTLTKISTFNGVVTPQKIGRLNLQLAKHGATNDFDSKKTDVIYLVDPTQLQDQRVVYEVIQILSQINDYRRAILSQKNSPK